MICRRHVSKVVRSCLLLLAVVVGGVAGSAPRVAEAQQFDTKIVMMDAGGENLRTLRSAAGEGFGTPSVSPDGKTLLYDRSANGQPGATHVFSILLDQVDQEAVNQEAQDLGAGNAPSWSPDGSSIVFYVTQNNTEQLKPGVWVMNADGSERSWLCEGKAARFSPEGDRLLVIGNPGGQGENIYQLDLQSAEVMPLLDRDYARIAGACWSPDGKRIAVIVRRANDADLLVVPTEGDDRTATIRLTADIGWRPNWSPDGKYLLLWVRDDEGRRKLHRLEVDGEKAPEILPHQDESSFNSDGIWSPDGKQILWARE